MRVELGELTWLDEHGELTLAELSEVSGLSEAELTELEDCGAIAPVDPAAATRTFHAQCIVVARTALRLRHDFELDDRGLTVALALIDRVRELESELRALQARLPRIG
ncbi:MAG TPA: chaperone modulator CbpM [Casimicrobiaceae bacterium]|nr:chaperone modulator CbpM [Casimicrobiaceae bacterium]